VNRGILPFETFVIVCAGYGVLGFALFLSRSLTLKRRFLRSYIVLGGFLFVGGLALTGFPLSVIALAIPMVALITWINLRLKHYCSAYGSTVWRNNPYARPRICTHCGADLWSQSARLRQN
jgi:hypothetical protein